MAISTVVMGTVMSDWVLEDLSQEGPPLDLQMCVVVFEDFLVRELQNLQEKNALNTQWPEAKEKLGNTHVY